MKTIGKIKVPDGAEKEAQLLYLHDIVSLVENHNIPDSLILNPDQTKLKHIPSANHTLAKKGSKSIEVVGSDDNSFIKRKFFTSATNIRWEGKSKSSAL